MKWLIDEMFPPEVAVEWGTEGMGLPREAESLSRALAKWLDSWAEGHPEPFPTA